MSLEDQRVSRPVFPLPWEVWAIVLIICCVAGYRPAKELLFGPFPAGASLPLTYLSYTLTLVVSLHAVFFGLNAILRKRDSAYRKRVPKYVEYGYAALLSISLAQIYFSGPRLADYIVYIHGTEESLLARIKDAAASHVSDDCETNKNWRSHFFDYSYCEELRRIANAPDLKTYVLTSVVTKQDFLDHVIDLDMTGDGRINIYSEVGPLALNLRSLVDHRLAADKPNVVFAWVALLLFPLGIGLRLVKTSLELFGDLDSTETQIAPVAG